jgi:hypothetical protein
MGIKGNTQGNEVNGKPKSWLDLIDVAILPIISGISGQSRQ